MDILLLQTSPGKDTLAENLTFVDLLLEKGGKFDMALLPEMFNTSYILGPDEMKPSDEETTLDWMAEKSGIGSYLLAGSIPVNAAGKFLNRWYGIAGSEHKFSYDKIHLFTPGGEARNYDSGKKLMQFTWQNWVIRPLICYDLRFPMVSLQDAENPYDILIYSANWPEARIEHWKRLLVARAIENQAYVVGINRVGKDHYGNVYPGASMVVDYMGNVMAEMGNQQGCAKLSLDKRALAAYRERFPFYKDAKVVDMVRMLKMS